MQLRRALLLFAVVLGLAALAASLSRPGEDSDRDGTPAGDGGRAPVADAGPPRRAAEIVELSAARPRTRRVEAGRAVTVTVAVDAPGTVEIPSLGLTSVADSLTPARFELLERDPRRHEIRFAPADGRQSRQAGAIEVRPAAS